MKNGTLTAAWLLLLLVQIAEAQPTERERIQQALASYERMTISIPHIAAPVTIDGNLQDAAWQQASRVDIAWQNSPLGGMPARSPTTAYVMADDEHLYVGFKADDADPASIPAFLRDRDQLFQDDYVGFGVDTNGDGSRAFEFFANALGVQGDAIVDALNGEDMSFDAIFETGGRITDEGFEVEFAIPLNQLRFPARAGKQQWKMFFMRTQYKDRRYQSFQYPIDRDNSCFICQFQPAHGLEGVTPGSQFQVVPAFTARSVRTTDPAVADSTERQNDLEPGIDDIRWGITPDISLNATLNPDFSQMEADVAQLDVNTTQALFFPERRPFFLEGRDFFNSRINLVNTRNITDPDYGIKLSGKSHSNVFGVMSARDSVTNIIVADSESSSIETLEQENQVTMMRYRRDFSDSSYLGMLLTDRSGDEYGNQVASIDGRYRISGRDTLQVQLAKSRSENPQILTDAHELGRKQDGDAYRVDYFHDSADWFWSATREYFHRDFRADAGFINQVDFDQTRVEIGRNWRGQPGAFVNNFNIGVELDYNDTNSTGELHRNTRTLFGNVNLPRNTQVHYNLNDTDQVYNGSQFYLRAHNLFVRSNLSGGLFVFSQVMWGDQIDFANTQRGKFLQLSEEVHYNLGRHILLRLRHTYRELDVDGGNLFTANLTDMRVTYRFSLRTAVRLTMIYNNLKRDPALYTASEVDRRSKDLDAQLLFSYQLNAQSELFAGYSTSSTQDDSLSGLERTTDAVFIKLAYAWQL